ncbi:MAG: fumarate hydratase [Thermoplasmata archaeon]|nr:fumarate hydratase [Thermoplasmata archaeon]
MLAEAISRAAWDVPADVEKSLRAAEREEEGAAREVLRSLIEGLDTARREKRPVCQDTGTVVFYARASPTFPYISHLTLSLSPAVEKATRETPLRPNTVNPFTGENPGDNSGRGMPVVHWELSGDLPGDEARVIVVLKGGGSENPSRTRMLDPVEGMDGVRRFVLETVAEAGGRPCPPVVVGVGIGGGMAEAAAMAKRAALKPVGERNGDREAAALEERLLEEVNSLGIGPMGLGGRTTALDVKVEWASRHPASLPAAVAFQCWIDRRKTVLFRIKNGVEGGVGEREKGEARMEARILDGWVEEGTGTPDAIQGTGEFAISPRERIGEAKEEDGSRPGGGSDG